MKAFIIKKAALHIGIGAVLYLLVRSFSPGKSIYAGFFAGFFGAAYLLAAWLEYLKAKGSEPLKSLRRRDKPGLPYYLRNPQKEPGTFLRLGGAKHLFDDDLEEMNGENPDGSIRPEKLSKMRAAAFLSVAILFLILSFI